MLDFEKMKEKAKNPASNLHTETSQIEGLASIRKQSFQADFCSLLGKPVPSMRELLKKLGGIAIKLQDSGALIYVLLLTQIP